MITQILDIIAPVFLLIAVGAAVTKLGWMTANGIDGLMSFAMKFAAPCLLFLSVLKLDLAQSFDVGLLVSFFGPASICFFLGLAAAILIFKRRPGEAVAIAFVALFSNAFLLGFPISERAYGVRNLDTNIAIIAIHAPFCYLLGISTMELLRADGQGLFRSLSTIIKTMFKNPLMIGISLGFVVNIFGIPMGNPVLPVIEMLSQVMLPAALFALGGVLTRYSIRASLPEASAMSFLSLIVHPMLAYLFATQIFDLQFEVMRNLVLTAAMAPGINAFLFATLYKRAEDVAANSVLLATFGSVVTASGWIWFLG
ncbi:MAG: AEC family transporter [Rhodobacteraceae bacterium]|nr:AEC family transporter [Paracoccaceae bacterium]